MGRELPGLPDQRRKADREAQAARGPYPLTPDPVGEVSEQDLTGNTEQADHAQCPDSDSRAEADVEQIFGLVNLHRVPDVQSAEIADRYPPEPHGATRPPQSPIVTAPA